MAYSVGQLQQLLIDAGCPADKVVVLAAVGMAESSGNPNAVNDGKGTRSTEYSVGLWQINTLAHKNYTIAQLKDPRINAREAVRILKVQGLRAWGAYTDGRYIRTGWLAKSQAARPSGVPAGDNSAANSDLALSSNDDLWLVAGVVVLALLLA